MISQLLTLIGVLAILAGLVLTGVAVIHPAVDSLSAIAAAATAIVTGALVVGVGRVLEILDHMSRELGVIAGQARAATGFRAVPGIEMNTSIHGNLAVRLADGRVVVRTQHGDIYFAGTDEARLEIGDPRSG